MVLCDILFIDLMSVLCCWFIHSRTRRRALSKCGLVNTFWVWLLWAQPVTILGSSTQGPHERAWFPLTRGNPFKAAPQGHGSLCCPLSQASDTLRGWRKWKPAISSVRVTSPTTLDAMAAYVFIPVWTWPATVCKLGFERGRYQGSTAWRLSDPLAASFMVLPHQVGVAPFSGWQIRRTPHSSGEEYTCSLLFCEDRFPLHQTSLLWSSYDHQRDGLEFRRNLPDCSRWSKRPSVLDLLFLH